MLTNLFLQIDSGSLGAAIIVAIIICIIFFAIQRRSIGPIKEKLAMLTIIDPKIQYDGTRHQTELQNLSSEMTNLKIQFPHTNEVTILQENVKRICDDFTALKTNIDDDINKFRLGTTEDLNKTKDQMITTATEKVVELANSHIAQNSVSREEFDNLRQRIEKMLGADEIAERIDILSS